MQYFLVRVGEGAKYISQARKQGYVAIGWNEVPDLRKFKDADGIKTALTKTSYGYSASQAGAQAGQLYRFGLEMQAGDIVLSPLGDGERNSGDTLLISS
jgi:predicted Mrr-cat superfamily restriction endonuclease